MKVNKTIASFHLGHAPGEDKPLHSRQKIHTITIILLMCLLSQVNASDMVAAGWIEKAILYPGAITLHAKLDTGAKTTSINAPEPSLFERDDEPWVRFTITNKDNRSTTIEKRIIREAKIKRHFGDQQVRPVILLDICIGNVRKTEEVNLVDRSNLNYQLLVGRNFLKDDLLIDSGSTYLLSPDCPD